MKTLNRILHKRKESNYPDSFSSDGSVIKDKRQIANKFNSFFYKYRPKSCLRNKATG